MEANQIHLLEDLNKLRSAPEIPMPQSENIFKELKEKIENSDWFTIGIMAPSSNVAISALRELEDCFSWEAMRIVEKPDIDGPVFLKANQNTGDVYIRIEYGLGEGILISCQQNDPNKKINTFGPFPLKFFQRIH